MLAFTTSLFKNITLCKLNKLFIDISGSLDSDDIKNYINKEIVLNTKNMPINEAIIDENKSQMMKNTEKTWLSLFKKHKAHFKSLILPFFLFENMTPKSLYAF